MGAVANNFIMLSPMVDDLYFVEPVSENIPFACSSEVRGVTRAEPAGIEPFRHVPKGKPTGGIVFQKASENVHSHGVDDGRHGHAHALYEV